MVLLKRCWKQYLLPCLAGAFAGLMLRFPREAAKAAADACLLWATAVLPSLFPFLVCMLWITGSIHPKKRSGISRLMGLPKVFLPVLAQGLFTGSPGGARLSQELDIKDSPGKKAALQRFALYAGTMSPMFFVGTLGGLLHNPALGWVLLLSHWMGALITGQLSRLLFPCFPLDAGREEKTGGTPVLSRVVSSAAMTMLMVCGLMMLGSVAAAMVQSLLPNAPDGILAGLQAFLEVTAGCSRLLTLPMPQALPALRPALLCAAASFGGMSILLQNYAFLQQGGVSLALLLLGRLCHGFLSFCLCLILSPLAGPSVSPVSMPVMDVPQAIPVVSLGLWFISLLCITKASRQSGNQPSTFDLFKSSRRRIRPRTGDPPDP